jgi:hypothetical protein
MRRKYRPYVALGAGLYLFIMWSAFRWEHSQHLPDGTIFDHIENERKRKFVEDQKEEQKKQLATRPTSGAELRLNAAPAFIAVRYDADHIVFMVATDSESRFAQASHALQARAPQKIAAPAQASAHLAGLEELWETDAGTSPRLPESVKDTVPGDEWTLSVSADSTVPVTIARAVTAPTGCSLALGFLAAVPETQKAAFTASREEYFVVRRVPVAAAESAFATPQAPLPSVAISANVPAAGPVHVAELTDWKPPAIFQNQITALLNQRMLQELPRLDATLRANGSVPEQNPEPWLAGNVRARRREWLHRDKKLAAGESQLDYDVRAFRLTPDGAPRLFVRARWKLDGAAAFLMTAWFRTEPGAEQLGAAQLGAAQPGAAPKDPQKASEPRLAQHDSEQHDLEMLSSDTSWSSTLREGRPGESLGDTLDFQTILNEFDDDHDGWAELLVHSTDGASAHFTLELYTDLGLVPTKTSFQRDLVSPESCVEQR